MQILRSATEILGSTWAFLGPPQIPSTRAEILGSTAAILGPRRRFWAPSSAWSRERQKPAITEITQNYPKQPHWPPPPGWKKKQAVRADDVITTPTLSRIWVNFCRNRPPWQQGGRRGPKLPFLSPFWCRSGVFSRGGRWGSLRDRCGAINNQWGQLWGQ